MKYNFQEGITKKEKRHIWNRFRVLFPDAKSKSVDVYRKNRGFFCFDKELGASYHIHLRRVGMMNDSEIGFKCTCDEKDKLNDFCYKNMVSMSNVCREAVNLYLNEKIFETEKIILTNKFS